MDEESLETIKKNTPIRSVLNNTELQICVAVNKLNKIKTCQYFFGSISRLGDGIFWYLIVLLLPFVKGLEGLNVSINMIVNALACLIIYLYVKKLFRRRRPFHSNLNLIVSTPALDRYSFPSGHSMHAVCFSSTIISIYPELLWILLPFVICLCMSRLILGLHYPSDVLVGILIGGFFGQFNFNYVAY
ncbi:phosphatase PAP2 family protein [Alteromonas portus]|uniref:phosphatase PAP2 family protein n=1 Tax=Alteromonas portus TaxID=2565549 RepID=UPI003BF77DA7